MRLVHFAGSGNFGDELNTVLWPALVPEPFDRTHRAGFLGIGTIIGMPTPGCDFLHVFSSGVGYDRLAGWDVPRRIWCVRGPLTAQMIGAGPDAALTDGAVLAPWVIPREAPAGAAPTGAAAIGVMPHWESLRDPGWHSACALAGFTLLDPVGDPVAVVRALGRMRLVLTESLHGAIVADAYGIPWVALCSSGNFSAFKWMDWALSMQLDLAVVLLPPPSVDALLRFGRPRPARDEATRWGAHVALSVRDAIEEFDRRTAPAPAAPRQGLSARARALLRPALTHSAPLRATLGHATGYHPARTAEHLARAARLAPSLSRPALRESRREQLAGRLAALGRAVAIEVAG